MKTNNHPDLFNKQYSVTIDTVPLPDITEDRVKVVMASVTPVINQIVSDAITVAIGTWPTPEKPRIKEQEKESLV